MPDNHNAEFKSLPQEERDALIWRGIQSCFLAIYQMRQEMYRALYEKGGQVQKRLHVPPFPGQPDLVNFVSATPMPNLSGNAPEWAENWIVPPRTDDPTP